MHEDESFELPVEINGQELLLPARLVRFGYSYSIHVDVEGQTIIFEPDEERNFRAMVHNTGKAISPAMIGAIIDALEKHLR